jgi:serine/threonine protein kinase
LSNFSGTIGLLDSLPRVDSRARRFAMPKERLLALMERWTAAYEEGKPVEPKELCADSPELLGELERLCRFDVRMSRLLGAMVSRETVSLGETPAPQRPGNLPHVEGYEILRELGQGGMGRVYHARDKRLDRDVALKMIRPERFSPDLHARFLAEARIVARLAHPHIVQIYEVGEYVPPEGGPAAPFLALEYSPGGTLEGRAGAGPMRPTDAARIVCLLARAMAHAHSRGVIHRDLKPSNVLIAEPADEPALNASIGRPRISDFGLARLGAGASAEYQPGLTTPGVIVGTPSYMAPEQAEGRIHEVGPACDVYSLGAILYRLLTGRAVFESDSVVSLLNDVCRTPPRPPSALVEGVPADLEAVCLRCLAKRSGDRPSAAELAAALDQEAGTIPLPPRPAPIRRRRRLLAAAILALAPLALLAWRMRPEPTRADRAEATHDPDRPRQPETQEPPRREEPAPLEGYLDARMARPGDQIRQNIPLSDPASRPMRPRDLIRVHAELSRPACVYLVWIDSSGAVTPMYPWIDGDWKRRGPEKKSKSYHLPRVNDEWEWWEMGPGRSGLEMMALLCREGPLPESVDLAALLGRFDPRPLAGEDGQTVAWFKNGEMVLDEKPRTPRGPLARPVKGGNPVERLNRELHRRVRGHFVLTRTITYGNEGDRP